MLIWLKQHQIQKVYSKLSGIKTGLKHYVILQTIVSIFFLPKIEEHCRELLTSKNLFDNKSDMYTVVESNILHSSAHEKLFLQNLVGKFYCEEHGLSDAELDKSHLCETDDCFICELIRTIFQSIICLFVKVSMAQFRRDYLSALKVYKST